ncbi:MAG: ABC transporter permease subunit [Dehalococcoidia bacterium]|nr:ABC transporter permease subunit [Dehalococcoidia bacterium]
MATQTQTLDQGILLGPELPFWRRIPRSMWKFTRRYPLGAVGAVFVVLLVAMAAVPALFTPMEAQDALQQNLGDRLLGPSWTHWFGTDELGRDLYARIIYGARTSIIIGFGVVVVTQVLAILFGTISGYYGGWFDSFFQRIIDIGIAVPGLVFIILVVQTLSPRMPQVLFLKPDMMALILSLSLLIAASSSRTIRGVALSLSTEQYVEGARSLGAHDIRIMWRHIVPNLFSIVIVSASILVGSAVLIESALSFLGYGVQPPTPSWGRMLNDARTQLTRAPHMAIFPGLVIFVTVYSFNMLGDALRDKLDPRLRGAN